MSGVVLKQARLHFLCPCGKFCPFIWCIDLRSECYVKLLQLRLKNAMTKQMNDLHWAACSGSVDILRRQLLTEGISIDSRNAEWETALYSASAAGRRDAVRVLIEAGAKVNARAKKRFSPLHVAVLFGHADLLPLLVNAGANLEAKTIRNMTPLGLAARFGHHSCVQFLLAQGVDVLGNDGDMFGRTPLHWAVKSGQEDIVSVLIKAGADVNVPDNFGKTSVMQVKIFKCFQYATGIKIQYTLSILVLQYMSCLGLLFSIIILPLICMSYVINFSEGLGIVFKQSILT